MDPDESSSHLSTPAEPSGALNPAADPRKMRRIIAEDPDWSLATVPDLVELCIKHVVGNFEKNPILNDLKQKHKNKVLELLSTEISLKVTARLVDDEGYWERCCTSRWSVCDTSLYGGLWKRMFFERHVQEMIENFVPEASDLNELTSTVILGGQFLRNLTIRQLLPPIRDMVSKEDNSSDVTSEDGEGPSMDHLDFGGLFKYIPRLEEVHVTYGVRNCGMNFSWDLFQFTKHDCSLLSKSVKACRTLRVLHLHRSQVDDEQARLLISHVLDHPSLTSLDLSHNKVSYRGARAIGKLLVSKCPLVSLNLCNNRIDSQGGGAIGHALQKNKKLTSLDLRLNRLCDDGGVSVLKSLVTNATLVELNLASNELAEASAQVVSEVAIQNKSLKKLVLSCNRLGEDGGKLIQEGMEDNETILSMDLRQTSISEESEYCINQLLKRNQDSANATAALAEFKKND